MKKLFGEVDNLNMFIHPKFNEHFKFMNDNQSVTLSEKILSEFIKSGFENIVVIESGTSPLIELIKKNEKYKNTKFNLIQVKIPRDLDFNLYEWFKTYLSYEEQEQKIQFNGKESSRIELLRTLCNEFNLENYVGNEKFTIYDSVSDKKNYDNSTKDFQEVLKGTYISKIFNAPFLLFDEYINAGTIIRNFNGIVRLFSNNPIFKLSAYCMFLDNPKDYEKIAFTLYDNSTELECYRNGAYPFENRIDLIGYYYFITDESFEKIYLNELEEEVNKLTEKENFEDFYNKLNDILNKEELLNKLKENLEEEQVRKYVDNTDIVRYVFKYIDEKLFGKNKYADFLDQVFELYAPSWSPMPVIFHLDYWNGFGKIKESIDEMCLKVEQEYKESRFAIIKLALNVLAEKKKQWELSISKEMEG